MEYDTLLSQSFLHFSSTLLPLFISTMADGDSVSTISELVSMFQQQMKDQQEQHLKQMDAMMALVTKTPPEPASGIPATVNTNIPSFSAFDPISELWTDYWSRFQTFLEAHAVPESRHVKVFLTNQSSVNYKLIDNMAKQLTPPRNINSLTLEEVAEFMKEQFHPKRFIVRERYKFWSDMKRKPGETIHELVARIRQDAVTCDFASITKPLDEAMRTRFMCSVDNEAVLKALFKIKDDELSFTKAIEIATDIEDAAKCAKETVYGEETSKVSKIRKFPTANNADARTKSKKSTDRQKPKQDFPHGTCGRCGSSAHSGKDCKFRTAECRFCKKTGHIERVCLQKKKSHLSKIETISTVTEIDSVPQIKMDLHIQDRNVSFEVDTGAGANFISSDIWHQLGKPHLHEVKDKFQSASKHHLPILGSFRSEVKVNNSSPESVCFVVTEVPQLNILGREAIKQLQISVDELLLQDPTVYKLEKAGQRTTGISKDGALQSACKQLCEEFPSLFSPGLGLLKDFELDIKFKEATTPIFCKPRMVPIALQEDLEAAYAEGIAKGVWKPATFSSFGTPVVPVRKKNPSGQPTGKVRVCGDYSVTVNPQLARHRHPIPLPEDLMRKFGGCHFFSKIDLADAYNQIQLSPASQEKLALSTHRGVLLQQRLPFGITSAPGYFQEIMDQLTQDLPGVATYMDDILVSGADAENHLSNLRGLLQRLEEKGLRCRKEKCIFAQRSIEYLGYVLSKEGIAKGPKVNAVTKMPAPKNVSELRAFLGQVQFYGKFLPNLSTVLEPLYRLTKKDNPWCWGTDEETSFQHVKDMLCTDTVLAHFDPSLDIGIACDASDCGIGAVFFHRYSDGSERPIANASKTLSPTQRKYSQIHKEALAIIFALSKFHQFLYGRKFIVVTDHKPLLSLFSPDKATPALAANRLARWALTLSQYDYTIEYRQSAKHGNADALSRLPSGPDPEFDKREGGEDMDSVFTILAISRQIRPTDPGVVAKESEKDPVISTVMRYCREGWPQSSTVSSAKEGKGHSVNSFKQIRDSLSCESRCLFYGSRLVIPLTLQQQVLHILHQGHSGMQRMKQLSRTAVYWPGLDAQIMDLCRSCQSCMEHQNSPPQAPIHPWMLPEKPWSRLHIDHAVNFMGHTWLVLIDAYSKYPIVHATSSTSSKATIQLLEEDFAHFGFPHTIVSDNATSFTSEEFQEWCTEHGITHLSGAPYHPATNGAAERLVQSFKNSLRKSSLAPKSALQEFLMTYRRTPLPSGLSPSEILNGRQIRAQIDILVPSPAHIAQGKQCASAVNAGIQSARSKVLHPYRVGKPVYAAYYGRKLDKDPRWVPATVSKRLGTRHLLVKVLPRGPIWKRHIEQLRPRYGADQDTDPGENVPTSTSSAQPPSKSPGPVAQTSGPVAQSRNQPSNSPPYGPGNPRKSKRARKPIQRMDW